MCLRVDKVAAGASWHATRWSCSRRRSVCAERAENRDESPALLASPAPSARIHSGGAPPREWRAAKRKYLSGRRLTTWNDNPSTLWINFNEINFTNFQLRVRCGNTQIRDACEEFSISVACFIWETRNRFANSRRPDWNFFGHSSRNMNRSFEPLSLAQSRHIAYAFVHVHSVLLDTKHTRAHVKSAGKIKAAPSEFFVRRRFFVLFSPLTSARPPWSALTAAS